MKTKTQIKSGKSGKVVSSVKSAVKPSKKSASAVLAEVVLEDTGPSKEQIFAQAEKEAKAKKSASKSKSAPTVQTAQTVQTPIVKASKSKSQQEKLDNDGLFSLHDLKKNLKNASKLSLSDKNLRAMLRKVKKEAKLAHRANERYLFNAEEFAKARDAVQAEIDRRVKKSEEK